MLQGQGQAQPVVNREFRAAVEPIQAGVTRAEEDSTFLRTLGQRQPRDPNLEQVRVTHVEFGGSEADQTHAELVQFSMSIFQDTSERISPCPRSAFHCKKALVSTLEIPTMPPEFEALLHPRG